MVQLVKIVSNDAANKSTTYLGDDGQQYVLTGDLSQRANNPGNISPTGTRSLYESQFGAIGYLPSSSGEPAVAVFPTLQQGQAAQQYLWSTPAYQNKTIAQAASSWASTPYISTLANAAGVTPDTKIADLSPQQMQAITTAQAGAEGTNNLRVTDSSGNQIPPAVFHGTAIDAANALAGAPSNPALAYAPNSPMASLYGPPPAMLTPPNGVFGNRLPPAAVNGVDKITPPGQHLAEPFIGYGGPTPATDATFGTPDPSQFEMNWGSPLSSQMQGMIAPQNAAMPPLPIPRPNPPQVAPIPFPGRPPDILPSTAGVPALVNLNGKMVKPGTYASPSNPGSTFTVADDGTGKAVVTNHDPGFMNIAKMGPGTVAGSVVGKTIGDATNAAKESVGQAANNVGASASQLGSNLAGFGGSLLSGIGGLFSHQPSTPSFLPSGNTWTVPKPPAPIPSMPAPALSYPGDLSGGGIPSVPRSVYPGDLSGGGASSLSAGTAYVPPLNLGIPPPSAATLARMGGTPPGTDLGLTGSIVPPMPLGNPSWLAPVMPQSAVFANNPIAQGVQQSKYGNLAQFLSGSQNNYGYINAAPGLSQAATHAILMAQQNRQSNIPSFGQNSSYAKNGGDVGYLNQVYG